MKIWSVVAVLVILLLAGYAFQTSRKATPEPALTATTSAYTATSPTSTEAALPSTPVPSTIHSRQGIVDGVVQLSPTCPVERIPPEPQCAPKPYVTTIEIRSGNALITTTKSSSSGTFHVALDPGTYTFTPLGGNGTPPSCQPMQVTVTAGQTGNITLSCDTGIR